MTASADLAGRMDDSLALRSLVWRSIALRAALAVVLHFTTSETLFAPDQLTYSIVGARLAQYWAGELLVEPAHLATSPHPKGYFKIVAAVYTVVGAEPLVMKLINAVVGGLTVAAVYDLAMRIAGSTAAAMRAARLTAYFPSLVLWSALNIRDAWIILFIVLICRQALLLQERFRPGTLVLLAFLVWGVVQFRAYLLFAVTLPMVLSFLIRNRTHFIRNVVAGMLVAGAVIYADQAAGSSRKLRTVDFDEIHDLRKWSGAGAQTAFEQVDISTPGKALAYLPRGPALFLLAPFPWMLGSVRQVLAVPETLYFYWLLPFIVRGIRYLLKQHLGTSLMAILITGALTFGYALGEGNAGTAYRHRAQLLPFFLIFASVGIEIRRKASASPQPLGVRVA